MFKFMGLIQESDFYIDFEFCDTSANSKRRLWTLTYSKEDKSLYGSLRRSYFDDSEFETYIGLPKKMVEVLFNTLPQSEKTFPVLSIESKFVSEYLFTPNKNTLMLDLAKIISSHDDLDSSFVQDVVNLFYSSDDKFNRDSFVKASGFEGSEII